MIDPIDGTNAFLRHMPEWTVSAALVEDGTRDRHRVQSGAARVLSRHQGSRRLPQRRADQCQRQGAASKARSDRERRLVQEEDLDRALARGRDGWVNSVAYRLALVACGRADATISLSAKSEWDLAAGVLIVEEAGGVVTDHRGEALRLIAPCRASLAWSRRPRALHAHLIERTSRIDL